MRRLALISLLLLPAALAAEMLRIDYSDPQGFGFNDPTPVPAVPGNPGTTLGEQRRAAFEAAVDIWASRLDSESLIRVEALFEDLGCGENTTLGRGGTTGLARDFFNAPKAGVNYPLSLAAALRGQIYSQFDAELRVRFNFRVDAEPCLDNISGYWYGLDPLTPPIQGTYSFLELAVHELGHGLGFQSLTERDNRQFFGDPPVPDVMSDFIFDLARDASWAEMTAAQRAQSDTSESNLVWIGPRANLRAAERLLPPGQITLAPDQPGSQRFEAWIQGYGPYLALDGLRARLVLAQGPGDSLPASDPWHRSLACQPLDNTDEVAGALVLVRRGDCTFASKWQNVFDAGGAGLLLVDNQPDGSAQAIARDFGIALDRNLPIPIWMVSDSTGLALRNAPVASTVLLGYDSTAPARGTREGFVNLEASPDNPDSNVSHFARSLAPRSVMNPFLSNSAFDGDPDLAPDLLHDLGWPDGTAKRGQYSGNWFNPERAGEGCQLTLEDGQDVPVLTCYLYRDGEQFWLIGNGVDRGDRLEFNEMIITEGADYGPAFDPQAVVLSDWGEIVMRPIDCNRARFDFQPFDPALPAYSSQMVKIVGGDCNLRAAQQPDRRRSGNYFDPQRGGEGVQLAVEADGRAWVLTFYTYLDGKQVWMIGSGNRLGNTIEFNDVVTTRGGDYGPDFDPDRVELLPFGRFILEFESCNDLRLELLSEDPRFPSGTREMTRIVPQEC
ncbi:PA domain-containing protein [Wenzhouxiangella marina]|uniref:PA domain-containing protein n=1 Tax=Wenzhouxiangella marina TaxID=1579979 RepID=A0A0K0XU02_9GAMM|nr:PA domain-containing protein [Wenzhouxiangella marina]AKS41102.1 hypothetical protein WM2015_721 [Wenzhouxiangella marina]MBB6087981.1 hypothetical protein [Wenzhouxiangella marina]